MNYFYRSWYRSLALYSLPIMALAGCTGLSEVDWEHGGRHGEIVQLIDGEAPTASLPPCVAALSPEVRAGRRFAKVSRRTMRTVRTEVVELSADIPAVVGTPVEVFPGNCEAGQLGRVTRVIAAK